MCSAADLRMYATWAAEVTCSAVSSQHNILSKATPQPHHQTKPVATVDGTTGINSAGDQRMTMWNHALALGINNFYGNKCP